MAVVLRSYAYIWLLRDVQNHFKAVSVRAYSHALQAHDAHFAAKLSELVAKQQQALLREDERADIAPAVLVVLCHLTRQKENLFAHERPQRLVEFYVKYALVLGHLLYCHHPAV